MPKILKQWTIVFIALLLLAVCFGVIIKKYSVKQTIVSPVARSPIQFFQSKIIRGKTLAEVMDAYEKDKDIEYGIVIKHLKTGESYTYHPHKSFEPASLYKLWVMAAVYDQIEKNNLRENQTLSTEVPVLNDAFNISTDSAELTEGTITNTVHDALDQMITKSDNYSALLLSYVINLSIVQKYLALHGLKESTIGEPPQTTASDIALFFEKLYHGELANPQHTQNMLNLLKNQMINGKLPKDLPRDMLIAHKTGELEDYTHDVGIVFGKNGDYIIVILSKGDIPADAEEQIADMSRIVYDYFENK